MKIQNQDLLLRCFKISFICVVVIVLYTDFAVPALIKTRLSENDYQRQRTNISNEIAVREYIKTKFPDRGQFANAYSKAVIKVAQKHKVKIPLIVAIASIESSWDHKAISSKKAVGLMQVMPSVWVETLKQEGYIKTKKDLLKPERNLEAGVFIYKTYKEGYKKAKNPARKALHRYSGGHVGYVGRINAGIEDYKAFKKELFKRG